MQKSEITLFADDTNILCGGKDIERDLKDSITEAILWFNENKLCVNSMKSQLMYFGKDLGLNLNPILSDCELQESVKFLGITLDRQLNFDFHIQQTVNKLNSICGGFYRIRDYYPISKPIQFYKVFAKPVISYGLLVYGCTNKKRLTRINTCRRKILRFIFYRKRTDSLQHYYRKHKILTVFDLHFLEILKETVEEIAKRSPCSFIDLENVSSCKYNTRNVKKGWIRQVKFNNAALGNSLRLRLTKTYNFCKSNYFFPSDIEIQKMNSKQPKNLVDQFFQNYLFDCKFFLR